MFMVTGRCHVAALQDFQDRICALARGTSAKIKGHTVCTSSEYGDSSQMRACLYKLQAFWVFSAIQFFKVLTLGCCV